MTQKISIRLTHFPQLLVPASQVPFVPGAADKRQVDKARGVHVYLVGQVPMQATAPTQPGEMLTCPFTVEGVQ